MEFQLNDHQAEYDVFQRTQVKNLRLIEEKNAGHSPRTKYSPRPFVMHQRCGKRWPEVCASGWGWALRIVGRVLEINGGK